MKKLLIIFSIFSFALFLSGCGQKTVSNIPTKTPIKSSEKVPLPTGEDIVRTFIGLISEKRISEAVDMMNIADEEQKQAWGVQFNAFQSIALSGIEKNGENSFKVILSVKMKPESKNNPIPYFGYEEGENVRWIGIKKGNNNLWKITGIATSP